MGVSWAQICHCEEVGSPHPGELRNLTCSVLVPRRSDSVSRGEPASAMKGEVGLGRRSRQARLPGDGHVREEILKYLSRRGSRWEGLQVREPGGFQNRSWRRRAKPAGKAGEARELARNTWIPSPHLSTPHGLCGRRRHRPPHFSARTPGIPLTPPFPWPLAPPPAAGAYCSPFEPHSGQAAVTSHNFRGFLAGVPRPTLTLLRSTSIGQPTCYFKYKSDRFPPHIKPFHGFSLNLE